MKRGSFLSVAGLCLSCAFACVLATPRARGDEISAAFIRVDDVPPAAIAVAKSQANLYRTFKMDIGAMKARLSRAMTEDAMRAARATSGAIGAVGVATDAGSAVEIPMPDGSLQRFAIFEVPVMEEELAAKFPFIKTYAGESLEVPGATVRLSMTARGFHAMVLSPEGDVFVNPAEEMPTEGTEFYVSFRREDAAEGGRLDCEMLGEVGEEEDSGSGFLTQQLRGSQLNTVNLAFVPTAEWSALHGGTVASVLSALAEHANRISAVFEREFCVRFVLPGAQDALIQFDPATDGLTNSSTTSLFEEGGSVLQRLAPGLPTGVRQVVGTLGGGVAQLGSACSSQVSVANSALSIDYVYTTMVACHEIGHMLGAAHSFGGYGERCGPNVGSVLEPGSGSTLMSYARQCYPDNIASESDLVFHARSLRSMSIGGSCGTRTATGNRNPSVVLPALPEGWTNFLPPDTPLALPVTAADPDGDAVTLMWDFATIGTQALLSSGDTGRNVLFRSWTPTSDRQRVIPVWDKLLMNEPSRGEILPSTDRSFAVAVLARDNRAGGGATTYFDFQLACRIAGGPFRIVSPNDGYSRATGPLLVRWEKAGTDVAPFSRSSVRISLMRSDSDRDPLVLAESTPNDGEEIVQLPDDLELPSARVLVQPIGAFFFDVSRKPFAIVTRSASDNLTFAGPIRVSDSFGNGNANGLADTGESRVRLFVPVLNAGASISENAWGTVTSLTPTVRVVVPDATWPVLGAGDVRENLTPFVISVLPSHPCGEPAILVLEVHGNGGIKTSTRLVEVGTLDATSPPQVVSYTGPAIVIPDGDATGVSVALNVPEMPGTVTDVKFRFDGTASTDPDSTGVGLNHPYVGDLVLELTNPEGTTIQIADRPGGVGNFGKNFAATLFTMDEIKSYIQQEIPRRAPYDGVFWPKDDLNLLAGGSGAGAWTLRVADMRAGQYPEVAPTTASAVRRFSLLLTRLLPPQCAAPKAYCEGDFNLDGVVDDADFSLFVVGYDAYFSGAGDLDGDTLTTDVDFSLFVVAYDAFACP